MNTERSKKRRITNVINRFLNDLYGSRSLFLISVICLLVCYPEVSARDRGAVEHTISAGVARVNITPSVPVVMAGYGSRTQPYEGINDSLYAVATVFDDGRTRAAIIKVEVLTFPHSAWEEITTLIENETGIPRDHILLVPTHTHGAPSTRVTGDSDRHLIDYNRMLTGKIVAVTAEAAGSMQPALVGSGSGICRMSMNRRALNAAGGIRIGRNPYGACDQEVGIVRIDNINGEPFSLIVNWPTHATVMGPGRLVPCRGLLPFRGRCRPRHGSLKGSLYPVLTLR